MPRRGNAAETARSKRFAKNESPKSSAVTPSEQKDPTVAIQEELKWYRLLFTLKLGAVVWIGLQVARVDKGTLDGIAGLFSIEADGLTAALVAMVSLLMGLWLLVAVIHTNIGRLGDPVLAQAGRVQGPVFLILALVGIPSFLWAPATAANFIRSGYHVVAIIVVLLLCVIADALLTRAARKKQSAASCPPTA